jgi:hypothetical protein
MVARQTSISAGNVSRFESYGQQSLFLAGTSSRCRSWHRRISGRIIIESTPHRVRHCKQPFLAGARPTLAPRIRSSSAGGVGRCQGLRSRPGLDLAIITLQTIANSKEAKLFSLLMPTPWQQAEALLTLTLPAVRALIFRRIRTTAKSSWRGQIETAHRVNNGILGVFNPVP